MIIFYNLSIFDLKECLALQCRSAVTLQLIFMLVIVLVNCFDGNAKRINDIDFHSYKINFQHLISKEIENSLVLKTIHSDELPHKEFLHHWFYSPRVEATVESINETLITLFSKQRSSEYNANHKETIRSEITKKLADYGLQINTQDFIVRSIRPTPLYGQNIIAILPGKFRDTANDTLTVIGAHYDTVEDCPGIDDNGSGATAVIEAAKVLSMRRAEFNHTVIFVLFDLEEWGALGSLAFVDHYLIPKELIGRKVLFKGALIADMLLNFDTKHKTQVFPNDIKTLLPEVNSDIERNGHRGDFLAIWMRKQIDDDLFTSFANSWKNEYKVLPMRAPISAPNVTQSEIQKYRTFLRSDHASFWIYKNTNYKLPLQAILLTDMGPWRGEQRVCYHDWCDDSRQLTQQNLAFLKNTIDSLINTIVG